MSIRTMCMVFVVYLTPTQPYTRSLDPLEKPVDQSLGDVSGGRVTCKKRPISVTYSPTHNAG